MQTTFITHGWTMEEPTENTLDESIKIAISTAMQVRVKIQQLRKFKCYA